MYKIAIALSAITMLVVSTFSKVHDTAGMFVIAWLGVAAFTATIVVVKPFLPKTDP